MCDDEIQFLFLDYGSEMFGAGFPGEDSPKVSFPAVVGRPKEADGGKPVVGEEAQKNKDLMNLECPTRHGAITNWTDMELILHHGFEQLQVIPEEHPVLITDHSLHTNADREKLVKMMFETFKVPALYVADQAVLSLFASGATDGVVFESDADCSAVIPVSEGSVIREAVLSVDKTDMEVDEIAKMINDSIEKCDAAIHSKLYGNILMPKESTPGLANRLRKELDTLAEGQTVNVTVPETGCSPWRGGSMIASLSTFKQKAINKEKYEEIGPAAVANSFEAVTK
ncbi:actin-57B-like [Lineus longissimus]|uniref:actin-57B-like n=1 Tax=Lineus longissimus TaxID=88925 RepID=UPI002B4EC7D7